MELTAERLAKAGQRRAGLRKCYMELILPTRLVRAWLTEKYKGRDPLARVVVPLFSHFECSVAGIIIRYPVLQPSISSAVRLCSETRSPGICRAGGSAPGLTGPRGRLDLDAPKSSQMLQRALGAATQHSPKGKPVPRRWLQHD